MTSPSSRAHRWANELKNVSENELHQKVSEYVNQMFDEQDPYSVFRTIATFLLLYKLPISLRKLYNYDRLMWELDRAITYTLHDTTMFLAFDDGTVSL
jgi:hypothetical protein